MGLGFRVSGYGFRVPLEGLPRCDRGYMREM